MRHAECSPRIDRNLALLGIYDPRTVLIRSMWDVETRRGIVQRLSKLQPTDAPRWGRLTARQMVVHLGDGARMALGSLRVHPSRVAAARWLRLPLVKHVFVYLLPFPHNAPTARELLSTPPGDWDDDVATFIRLSELLSERAVDTRSRWPEHPFFGRLSCRDWGALGYWHTDHHLRQFGA